MDPTTYITNDGVIIEESVLRSKICHYLKGDGEESKETPRAGSWWDSIPFGRHEDKSTDHPNMSGRSRTPRKSDPSLVDLATPIANLLIDLKMMHDDM